MANTKIEEITSETHVKFELKRLHKADGLFYLRAISTTFDGKTLHDEEFGPFPTQAVCDEVAEEILEFSRSLGSVDLPSGKAN
jgi:hypothetical protein